MRPRGPQNRFLGSILRLETICRFFLAGLMVVTSGRHSMVPHWCLRRPKSDKNGKFVPCVATTMTDGYESCPKHNRQSLMHEDIAGHGCGDARRHGTHFPFLPLFGRLRHLCGTMLWRPLVTSIQPAGKKSADRF